MTPARQSPFLSLGHDLEGRSAVAIFHRRETAARSDSSLQSAHHAICHSRACLSGSPFAVDVARAPHGSRADARTDRDVVAVRAAVGLTLCRQLAARFASLGPRGCPDDAAATGLELDAG